MATTGDRELRPTFVRNLRSEQIPISVRVPLYSRIRTRLARRDSVPDALVDLILFILCAPDLLGYSLYIGTPDPPIGGVGRGAQMWKAE